ncbi:NF-X1-type zinc finger protein NFXL1-like [Telopea speciosissima]|uniref:NF-X1-type zinc finger protein NFXL1-like n=1 Tax=Telopea speciosissima TaxID=54955 RepID=UPI001CC738AA|nr:NF-X1-type zinc finger protein NFXL1-like [Telopea speciosissima]
MSYQQRSDRREGPRVPARTARQEWVPRGSIATVVNPPSSFNSNPNGNGGDSNYSSAPPSNRHRGGFARRRYTAPPAHPKNDPEILEPMVFDVPQLVQEIQDKLAKRAVECMICYDMVGRSAPIWSCSSCYSIFHLNCIKKWARAPTSVDLSVEKNQRGNWRCPGCQSVQLLTAKEIQYLCFCGKRPDPPTDLYLTPHSCGEPCGKPLDREVAGGGDSNDDDRCPHVCVLQCHPGPCPPCKAFAPPRRCPCGKKTITTRCSDRKSLFTCGQPCKKILECGRHRCERICHLGPCDPCGAMIKASCFCKKKVEILLCGEMVVKGNVRQMDGVFSCNSTCGKELACGNHFCGEDCHPGPCGDCELTPWRIKTCYCGKTRIQNERRSCLDTIPTCSQACGKLLPCGIHQCKESCHARDCPTCLVPANQKCRCGSSSRTVECYRTVDEMDKFVCDKPCGRKKSCGRHRCSERCCPLSGSSNQVLGHWDPHLCSMVCGKKLRCGQHSCGSLCHSGHCPPCLETIFTDLACACGKTSIPPPQPCGTPPPSCQHPCSVPQPCGHPPSHSCHFGDCPPCSIPVAKECIGEHVVLRNIPCGTRDIRCNQLCGKTRQCGMHACGRTCHPPPCDSNSGSESGSGSGVKVSCGQICSSPRRDCRHTCTATCHPSSPCPDLRCDFPVTITCSCGRITATVPCDAGGSGHVDTVFEASVIHKLPVPLHPVEATGKKVPLGQRKLACDEECTKLERRRVLADAFDITPPNLDALHFGENSTVSDVLADLYRRDPKWVLSIEERFRFLVIGKSRGGTSSSLRVHVFCPMVKEKRDAVRQIAVRWKLAIHAAGWEPKRFLVVHVTPKSKAPSRILGAKGAVTVAMSQPVFDPLVDMDPRLVVAFLDLPRDADISALVLRFGGECELVWLNDKNALAVFSDPARAATALRRLDHGSVYHGAAVVLQNGGPTSSGLNAWGTGAAKEGSVVTTHKGNPWKKSVVQESSWRDDSWGGRESPGASADVLVSAWKGKEAPFAPSRNRWGILDSDAFSNSAATSSVGTDDTGNHWVASSSTSGLETNTSGSSSTVQPGVLNDAELSEVVDDWEKAYE